MATTKCPVCGKEIQNDTPFCPWCGAKLNFNTENSNTPDHQWPEEEKSVSFTIYEAPAPNQNQENLLPEDVPVTPKPEKKVGWGTAHIVVCILLVLFSVGISLFFTLYKSNTQVHMPEYGKIEERQKEIRERREKKMEEQRQDAMRIEEELKRQREEEERAQRLLDEEKRIQDSIDASMPRVESDEEFEAKLQEILNRHSEE